MSKVALITAAGSGLGAACARELAAAGYQVAVSSSSGKGEQLGKELGGLGFTASNTSVEDIDRIVRETFAARGRIDVVVNSCGAVPRGDLLTISDQDWHAALDMILLSVIRIARAVTPIFAHRSLRSRPGSDAFSSWCSAMAGRQFQGRSR